MRCLDCRDEELTAIRVGSRIRHGEEKGLVVFQIEVPNESQLARHADLVAQQILTRR